MEPATPSPQVSGNVMFYKKPEPLNPQQHGKLGVKNIDRPLAFMGQTHFVPVVVNEFGMAAAAYPLIFLGDEKAPVAVMGARTGENMFLTDGTPELDLYMPMFVRRYPFVFAAQQDGQTLTLCVDTEAEMVGENAERPFFDGDKPSAFTNQMMEFCQEFERNRQSTQRFVEIVDKAGLFDRKNVTFRPTNPDGSQGPEQRIAEYWAVSEEKLNGLDDAAWTELRKENVLPAIYAHMLSNLNWQKLINRTLRRSQAAQTATGQA